MNAGDREEVREHVPDVARREDPEDVPDEQHEADVDDHVHRHRQARDVPPVQRVELLDRHVVARDPVQRARAVRGRRVHRDDEARDDHDHEEVRQRRRAGERLQRPDVVERGDRLLADAADEAERQERVDDEGEDARRAQRELRVVDRVLVLGRERRARVHAPRGPGHDPEPDEREPDDLPGRDRGRLLARAGRPVERSPGEVGAVEVAVQERQDHEHEERDHEQRAREVAEPDGDANAAEVEEPDGEDQPDRDQVRQADLGIAGREVALALGAAEERAPERLVREPGGRDDLPAEDAEEREHDRPREPVAERRDRADEREVLAPALVRVEREAARLVREHGRHLGVERHDEEGEPGRDPPEQHGAPPADVSDRVAERSEQEARRRECDHEAVVPAELLEEMSFLDNRFSHGQPPGERSRRRLPRGGPITPSPRGFNPCHGIGVARAAIRADLQSTGGRPAPPIAIRASAAARRLSPTASAGRAPTAGARGTRRRSPRPSTRGETGR